VPFWPLDPGSGMGKKSGSAIRIRDKQPGSYFRELRSHCFGLKYLNCLMQIRDPGWSKFGSGVEKIRIQDKHPDPQHCWPHSFINHILAYLCIGLSLCRKQCLAWGSPLMPNFWLRLWSPTSSSEHREGFTLRCQAAWP
jgi:hypothetical protein